LRTRANKPVHPALLYPDTLVAMHTFKKNERLGNFRLRQLLFTRGKHFFHYPFRVVWLCFPREELPKVFPGKMIPSNARFTYPSKFLVSVPRRNFNKAVHRNRVKRLVREAFRKNKNSFYSFLDRKNACCLLGMIYAGKNMPDYAATMRSVREVLDILAERIDKEGLDHEGDARQIIGE